MLLDSIVGDVVSDRTLSHVGTWEVAVWVQRETFGFKSVLDFGSGLGAYTRVALCDVRDGIEAYEPYVMEAKSDPANAGCRFFLGDMRGWSSIVDRDYDLAMFVDTLEHLPKADAFGLIEECKAKFSKILLYLPLGVHLQGPCDGNELQSHLSYWNQLDVVDMDFEGKMFKVNPNDKSEIPLLGSFLTWEKR